MCQVPITVTIIYLPKHEWTKELYCKDQATASDIHSLMQKQQSHFGTITIIIVPSTNNSNNNNSKLPKQ